MTRVDAEIGVVGAGPAGARAAELLAAAGASVLVWDPRAPWEKPCGGGLPAAAFRNVPDLVELRSGARRIDAIRAEPAPGVGFTVALDRPMYMVSRRELARWQLRRLGREGVDVLPAAVRSINRAAGEWRITDGTGRDWTVRRLVGGDGAASRVRRTVAPAFRVGLVPTRVAYPAGPGDTPDTIVVRLYDDIPSYLWDFPRSDHRSVGVGVLSPAWGRRRMDREVDAYVRSRDGRTSVGMRRAGAAIGTAGLGHGDFSVVGSADFALLGDAAGFADPATGEGIESALRSAALLADAYRQDGSFASYPSRARAAFEREFRVARRVRTLFFDRGLGVRTVRRGLGYDWAVALTETLVNAINEHTARPRWLLTRWLTAYRNPRTGAGRE